MIIVLGSINVDQVYQVDQLPKPGETRMGHGYLQVPGGKGGNQALAARRAGSEVIMLGAVGDDANREVALSLLEQDEVNVVGVKTTNLPTGSASIWVDDSAENSIIVNGGANNLVTADQLRDTPLSEGDFLALQMEIPQEEVIKAAAIAKEYGAKTVLNLAPYAPMDRSAFANIDYLIVNETEATNLVTHLGGAAAEMRDKCFYLSEELHVTCILTLGDKGVFYTMGTEIIHINAMRVKAVDTTAAGDCFTGYFTAALDQQRPLNHAVIYATKGAGLACMRAGAQSSIPWAENIDL